jgi:MFS family permease
LTYAEIGTLGSVSAAVTVVGEVPTGYVGDRVGRRWSLVVGAVLMAGSLLGFLFARSFAAFAVLWVLWAVGAAFRSGSADAWLYDTLRGGAATRGEGTDGVDETAYTRIRGRGGAVSQAVTAVTSLTAGGLYAVDRRLPFVAGAVLVVLSVPVVLSFPRARARRERPGVAAALPLLRDRLARPPLRSVVALVAVFLGVVGAADTFVQPVAVGPVGLSETALGSLYAGFTVVAAVASYFAAAVERRLSTRGTLLVVSTLVGGALVVPVVLPVSALVLFFLMKSGEAVTRPVVSGHLNDHVESAGRATVLSAAALAYALVRLPLGPAAGTLADRTTPLVALAALGGGLLGVAAVVYGSGRLAGAEGG